jgi:hypothetical protein
MLQIGSSNPSPEGPAGLLLACHTRIRSFTDLAARLAGPEAADDGAIADAAARVHRYHSVALPLHQADEEESIEPRLIQAAPETLPFLAQMRHGHVEIEALVSGLLPRWKLIASTPSLRGEIETGRDVQRLQTLWSAHLTLEEKEIFPALSRLGADDLAAIQDEMRARRATP